jgi:hypothetical protein
VAREGPPEPAPLPKQQPAHPAEAARGGDIVLRTRAQRAIFLAGLVGAAVLALFGAVLLGVGVTR